MRKRFRNLTIKNTLLSEKQFKDKVYGFSLFQDVILTHCLIKNITFFRTRFSGVRFENCDFKGASFVGCNIADVTFEQCNFLVWEHNNLIVKNRIQGCNFDFQPRSIFDKCRFHSVRITKRTPKNGSFITSEAGTLVLDSQMGATSYYNCNTVGLLRRHNPNVKTTLALPAPKTKKENDEKAYIFVSKGLC
jgi:uncharacterized protein YjbI with pentapeptide repeats